MPKRATRDLDPELLPMLNCPRHDGCSAPVCPLDRKMHKRTGPFGDELRCRLPKAQRMELGEGLSWRGLWPREIAAMNKWENGTDAQRASQIASGRKNLDLA